MILNQKTRWQTLSQWDFTLLKSSSLHCRTHATNIYVETVVNCRQMNIKTGSFFPAKKTRSKLNFKTIFTPVISRWWRDVTSFLFLVILWRIASLFPWSSFNTWEFLLYHNLFSFVISFVYIILMYFSWHVFPAETAGTISISPLSSSSSLRYCH